MGPNDLEISEISENKTKAKTVKKESAGLYLDQPQCLILLGFAATNIVNFQLSFAIGLCPQYPALWGLIAPQPKIQGNPCKMNLGVLN